MHDCTARRMGWIGLGLAMALGSLGNACSSAEPDAPPAESAATTGSELSFDASAATQSELGIVSWKGVTNDEQTTIRGVDANGKAMLTMEGRIYDESGIHHVREQVTVAGRSATFDLQTKTMNGGSAVRFESTLTDGPNAVSRAVGLLLADLTAADEETTASLTGTSTSSTASIGFRDVALTQNSQCSLLRNCNQKTLLQVTSAVAASLSCTVAAPLVAIDGWKMAVDVLNGAGVTDSIKNGIETSSCVQDFGTAWKNNTPGGPLDSACEKTTTDGCPISKDTPCYPGCKSGLECVDDQCIIAANGYPGSK